MFSAHFSLEKVLEPSVYLTLSSTSVLLLFGWATAVFPLGRSKNAQNHPHHRNPARFLADSLVEARFLCPFDDLLESGLFHVCFCHVIKGSETYRDYSISIFCLFVVENCPNINKISLSFSLARFCTHALSFKDTNCSITTAPISRVGILSSTIIL